MASHYGTRDGADAFHDARGRQAWGAASEAAREAALVRASGYIDGHYRDRFSGRKARGRAQPLEWPRLNAVDTSGEAIGADEIPAEVVSAAYEAALREVMAPGSLSPDLGTAPTITSKRVKAGPVETETSFAEASAGRPVFSVIDDMLAGLLVTPRSQTVSTSFLMRA